MKGSKSAHARTNPRTARDTQQQSQSTNRGGSRSAFAYISTKPYRERKEEVTRNLKDLEEDNARLQDFMKKLNVLIEKVKHNGALLKQNITTECDNLVKIIEKKKRAMVSQVDKHQYRKVRELEGQMTYCRRLFSTGHSVVVRTNRDLENLSMPTFMKKSDTLISDIESTIRDQPYWRPVEDDKYDIEIDLTEQREALDQMELKGGDLNEDKNNASGRSETRGESRDTYRDQSPRDYKETKKKPLIQKLMEEDDEKRREKQTRGTTKASKSKEKKKAKAKELEKEVEKEVKKEEPVQLDAMNGKDEAVEETDTKHSGEDKTPPESEKDEKQSDGENKQTRDEHKKSAKDLQDDGTYEDKEFEQSDHGDSEEPEEVQDIQSEKFQSQSALSTNEKDKDDEVQSSIPEDIESSSAKNTKRPSRSSSSSLSASEKERKVSDARTTVSGSKRSIQKETEEGVVIDETGGVDQSAEENNSDGEDTKSSDK